MASVAFLFSIVKQGKQIYSKIKGSDYINVYNLNALNLKCFEEIWAPPIFTCGITRGVQYSCELGQDLAVKLPTQTLQIRSVPEFELRVRFLTP